MKMLFEVSIIDKEKSLTIIVRNVRAQDAEWAEMFGLDILLNRLKLSRENSKDRFSVVEVARIIDCHKVE